MGLKYLIAGRFVSEIKPFKFYYKAGVLSSSYIDIHILTGSASVTVDRVLGFI